MIFANAMISKIHKYVVVFYRSHATNDKGVYLITSLQRGWTVNPTLLAVRRLDLYRSYTEAYLNEDNIISVLFGKSVGD
jgi:hypothetical protein